MAASHWQSGQQVWWQGTISLKARSRGFHLITEEVLSGLPSISSMQVGWLQLLLQHTSASISLNENADPSVCTDFDAYLDRSVPDDTPYFRHSYEGADDMPAHIKSGLLGASLLLPIGSGQLRLGTWQGIWLGEHRNRGGSRRIVATLQGLVAK